VKRRYAWKDLIRLPSLVSLTRVPLGLAFLAVAPERPIVALSLLALAAASDVLDGFLARKRGEVSATGAVVDPLADKWFVALVVITLIASGRLSVVRALLLATRELGEIPLLIWFAFAHEISPEQPMASALGKAATVSQFISVAWLVFGLPSAGVWLALTAILGAGAALSYAASFARFSHAHR